MEIIQKIQSEILDPIIVLLFGVAVVYFLYGLLKFIQNPDNATAQQEGRQHMLWGVIGIFLMIAVYGLLNFAANIVGAPRPY